MARGEITVLCIVGFLLWNTLLLLVFFIYVCMYVHVYVHTYVYVYVIVYGLFVRENDSCICHQVFSYLECVFFDVMKSKLNFYQSIES